MLYAILPLHSGAAFFTSTLMTGSSDARLALAERWLHAILPGAEWRIAPASADASFRRYFRVRFADARPSAILMDAPPEREDCRPFVRVAALFGAAGVNVPRVLASDIAQGFLLLTDLGEQTYLQALATADADALYREALAALVRIQAASREGALPPYDRELLARELALFPDWYVGKQLERSLSAAERRVLDVTFERLLENNLAQPRVFVHRDYHSRNLMTGAPGPGVLDFQDAVFGPVTYDLVSLLRDAYVDWPEDRVLDWAIRYWEMARAAGVPVASDFGAFYRDFEWMGAQRQLKVIGIFARLAFRDGKRGYLDDQPRVMRYLRATCARYDELAALGDLLDALAGTARASGYTF
jgi:N-acetylmuramate 1-kinase